MGQRHLQEPQAELGRGQGQQPEVPWSPALALKLGARLDLGYEDVALVDFFGNKATRHIKVFVQLYPSLHLTRGQ